MNDIVEQSKPKTAYERLPRRYRRFVDEYVGGKTGAEAMRKAGCKTLYPHNRAWEVLQRPEVRSAIDERERYAVAEAGARHVTVIRELQWLATCDPRKLVNGEGVQIPLHELPADIAACISSVEIENISYNDETGTRYKYRFWDKNKALDKLGQYLKLWDTKGPTVNVDARSVTNNTVHVGGSEAIRSVAELSRHIAGIGASQSVPVSDPNGLVLSPAVRDEPKGHRASVDAGEDT